MCKGNPSARQPENNRSHDQIEQMYSPSFVRFPDTARDSALLSGHKILWYRLEAVGTESPIFLSVAVSQTATYASDDFSYPHLESLPSGSDNFTKEAYYTIQQSTEEKRNEDIKGGMRKSPR